MPEPAEPESEQPPDAEQFREVVDEAGGDYEQRAADLERYRRRLEDESGEPWRVEHFGFEFSEDATAEVVVWPNGEVTWASTQWTPPDNSD
jgi:hypothetical protein